MFLILPFFCLVLPPPKTRQNSSEEGETKEETQGSTEQKEAGASSTNARIAQESQKLRYYFVVFEAIDGPRAIFSGT